MRGGANKDGLPNFTTLDGISKGLGTPQTAVLDQALKGVPRTTNQLPN